MTEPAVPDSPGAAVAAAADAADIEGAPPAFDAPWQARAFAMAVALCESGAYEWPDFQGRLVEHIEAADPAEMQADVEGVYYRAWMAALEDLLRDTDVLTDAELDERQAEFGAGERDESEFERVEGPGGR